MFNSADKYTNARYLNLTHIGCDLPMYTGEDAIYVDVTFDRRFTFSASPVIIYLVPSPTIVSLNNTEYYYTHHE